MAIKTMPLGINNALFKKSASLRQSGLIFFNFATILQKFWGPRKWAFFIQTSVGDIVEGAWGSAGLCRPAVMDRCRMKDEGGTRPRGSEGISGKSDEMLSLVQIQLHLDGAFRLITNTFCATAIKLWTYL